MQKNNIYIVIPSYNEEKHIGAVLQEFSKSGYPIVFVDDGSRDDTFKIAQKYKILALKHKVNLGKGAALKTGCEAAFSRGADAIVMMDSDGQHKVSDLGKFIEALDKGCDIVFGSRNLSHGVPLVRYLGNKTASILVSYLFGIYISDLLCGYRAFTKKAYKKIIWDSKGYGVETEMVVNSAKAKLSHCEVGVETVYLDTVKGVTILDAVNILGDVIKWKITR